jgi:ferric-dicitrate binding protein FerR (iron transport regulator)
MPENRLSYLLKRHLSRQISSGESEELAALIGQLDDEQLNAALQLCWNEYEVTKMLDEQKGADILSAIFLASPAATPVHRIHFLRRRWVRFAAASVIIIFIAGTITWRLYRNNMTGPVQNMVVATNASKAYIRNLTLPDGSTVVLQAGSTLDFPAAFNGNTREVSLSGEAYFDIERDATKPFIIHTGKISTTVLGTAFNIKAYPGQHNIVVSVTRGKVKVEDEQKLLAVLTPDQQLNYQSENAMASERKVDANTLVTDWTKQDMVFDESSFTTVAEVLSKRYGVTIRFNNDDLQHCPIHASFKGTEKLENVLNIVCKVQEATYEMKDDKTILISGRGCGN